MCANAKSRQAKRSRVRQVQLKTGAHRTGKPAAVLVSRRKTPLLREFPFLEVLFEHSPDAIILLDKALKVLRVNKVYAHWQGRRESDFPGLAYSELFPGGEAKTIIDRAIRRKRPCQLAHSPFVLPERPEWGVTYWDWTVVPILDHKDEVEVLVLSLRDVTLRKRMERELEESEERYRSLVTATAQIVWTTNPQGEIVRELPTWQAFTGQTQEQYRGRGWTSAVHPDDRERVVRVWAHVLAEQGMYEAEYRLRRNDGEYRHVVARGVPVKDDNGAIREWVGTCTDITKGKENERRRDFTSALLALFAQKSSAREYLDAVVETIRQWSGCQALGIRVVNECQELPYESWTGFDPEFVELEQRISLERDTCCCIRAVSQMFEEQDREIVTPGGSFRCDDAVRHIQQLPLETQARFRGNCVNFGYASLAVVPIRYRERTIGVVHLADRRPGQFPLATIEFIESMAPLIGEALHRFKAEAELAHYRDRLEILVKQRTEELEAANARLQIEIAQRKRAQEILQETAQELERSNRDLEQFAYVASHDLQEPLRAVGGFVRLLQHRFPQQLDAKAVGYINGAAEGATRMGHLITDLLAFARVRTEPSALVVCDFNVLLSSALHNLQVGIRSAQATIEKSPLPSLEADPTQIIQLFQNLVGNAVKFRSERPLKIRIGARSEGSRWIFWVGDNGIGIDPQYFPRVFQIFQRLHTRKSYPGTGIGLAICKRIVERHGGAIWLESQPDQGSTFYFSLPATAAIRGAGE